MLHLVRRAGLLNRLPWYAHSLAGKDMPLVLSLHDIGHDRPRECASHADDMSSMQSDGNLPC